MNKLFLQDPEIRKFERCICRYYLLFLNILLWALLHSEQISRQRKKKIYFRFIIFFSKLCKIHHIFCPFSLIRNLWLVLHNLNDHGPTRRYFHTNLYMYFLLSTIGDAKTLFGGIKTSYFMKPHNCWQMHA